MRVSKARSETRQNKSVRRKLAHAATSHHISRPASTNARSTSVVESRAHAPVQLPSPLHSSSVRLPKGTPTISVVVPAKNEARNLAYVLPALAGTVHEVILVDGHSTDATVQVARALLPDIRVVTQPGRGKGDALRCGFAVATGDIIVMLDADGSTNPYEIPRFVQALVNGADVAKGSRFVAALHGFRAGSGDITALRRTGNRALNQLVNMLFGTSFTDLCYGYNAFWATSLEQVNVDAAGFEVETLISLRAHKARLKIVEVPSFELPRVHGKSNLHPFRDGLRVLRTILRERSTGHRPPGRVGQFSFSDELRAIPMDR